MCLKLHSVCTQKCINLVRIEQPEACVMSKATWKPAVGSVLPANIVEIQSELRFFTEQNRIQSLLLKSR